MAHGPKSRYQRVSKEPRLEVNPAEFFALRVVVSALVATMALEAEEARQGTREGYIERLAMACREVIAGANIEIGSADSAAFRDEALHHLIAIVSSVRLDKPKPN